MNALINATQTQTVTMTSLELVEFINSQRKADEAVLRHDSFMAKVPKVLGEAHAPTFIGTQNYGNNNSRLIYVFPKREACLMAMSYSYELQAVVYDRMTALEAKQTAFDITNPVHLLQAIEVQARLNIQLAAERDHAIATKAQIGSKREATAMATASKATRERNAMAAELGRSSSHATVLVVQKITGIAYKWQPLKAYCNTNKIKPASVFCPRYETALSYPAAAWLAVHGVDIAALFGGVEV